MAKGSNTVDYRVKLAIDSKEYRQALRQANQEAKEFKKQQRDSFKTAGKDAGDAFSTIIGLAKKVAPALGGAATAYNIINTAVKENQTLTDQWARVTESARASYESFVNALVNTDLSSWVQNFGSVLATARELADAFDALDTAKIFNSRAMAEFNVQSEKYRYILNSPTATAAEKAAAAAGLKGVQTQREAEMKSMSNQYYETFAKEFAARMTQHGSPTNWQDVLSQNADGFWELSKNSKYQTLFSTLGNYNAAYAKYQDELERRRDVWEVTATGQRYKVKEGKGLMSDADFKDLQAAIQISDEKLQELFNKLIAAYNGQAEFYRTIRRDDRFLSKAEGSSDKAAPYSIAWYKEQIAEYAKAYEYAISDAERQAAKAHVDKLELELERLKNGEQKFGNVLAPIDSTAAMAMGVTVDPSKLKPLGDAKPLETAAKDTTKYIDILSDSIQSLGLISVKADSEFGKFLMVARMFLSLVKSVDGGLGTGGKWYDKLFSIVGSVVGVGFAGGGIVGGTSYKGDRLPAMVNSREMILNGFQQKQLFDMITAGGGQTGSGAAVVTGENIYIALRNYGRRSGKKITIE